jgi:hypothetical protein
MKYSEEDRKVLLKHLIVTQVMLEISDDCIDKKLITQRQKQETKRFSAFLEKEHKVNFKNMYAIDSGTYVNLTDMIDQIAEKLAELSLEEMLTFNKKINEFITVTKENTPKPKQSGTDNVHRDNTEEIRETVLG